MTSGKTIYAIVAVVAVIAVAGVAGYIALDKDGGEEYTVSFDMQGHGTAPVPQKVHRDGKVTEPSPAPTATGYSFGGWYKETACTTAWDFGRGTVTADMALFAKWIFTGHTVTFDMQGHGTQIDPRVVDDGGKVTKPTDPSQTGYTFGGWYKEAGCTTEWNFSTETVDEDITLYAKWTAVRYTVAFNVQGHGTEPSSQTVDYGGKVTEPDDPSAEGFVFGGWYKESSCTTPWDFDTDTVSGNTTLYAKWVIPTVLIMDQYGVYQLLEVHGENVTEALTGAGDRGLITVEILKEDWGSYLKTVNGLQGKDDYSAYWTLYLLDDSEWTLSTEGIDQIGLGHDCIGLFYMEYDPQTYQPTKGGPDQLADKIPDTGDAKWDGSDDGVLFEFVSGSGLTVYLNGTYEENTVWDAFQNVVSTFGIPFERQGQSGIATLFDVEEWNADDSQFLEDDYGNLIQVYWVYWMQYVHTESGWEWSSSYMDQLSASDNPNMRIMVNPYYYPNGTVDVGFTYDETKVDLVLEMDDEPVSSIKATIGSGMTVMSTEAGNTLKFVFVGDFDVHTCTATIVPKEAGQTFSFYIGDDKITDGTQVPSTALTVTVREDSARSAS